MTEEVQEPIEEAATQEPPQEAPAKAWSDEDENEARFFGWKPPVEWQGDKPSGYIENPVEWLDRVKRSKTFTAMETRLKKREQEAADHARRIEAVYRRTTDQQRADYERQIAELTARQRAAVETADTQEFDRLQEMRDRMRPPEPEPVPDTNSRQVVSEYVSKNDWAKNPILWEEAKQAVNIALRAGVVADDASSQLTYAEGVMKQKYPHLFQVAQPVQPAATRHARPSPVDGGGLGAGSGGDPFAKLPADARAAFANMVKRGDFKDDAAGRKQFVEFYNEG